MSNIHITFQGKGGSGKTTISSFSAQFLRDNNRQVACFDTDPVNTSFLSFKSLNVEALRIMNEGVIDGRAWDVLVEKMARTKMDVVVDNGSTSFTSLLSYITGNQSFNLVKECGHNVTIHIPINGGAGLGFTVGGMQQIIEHLAPQDLKFVIWLNSYFGPIERAGEHFESFTEYKACKKHISTIIKLPLFVPHDTFGRDMAYLLTQNLTFSEALETEEKTDEDGDMEFCSKHGFGIAMMQRIAIMRDRLYKLLDASGEFI